MQSHSLVGTVLGTIPFIVDRNAPPSLTPTRTLNLNRSLGTRPYPLPTRKAPERPSERTSRE
jgi:hypothetical protein